jgi:hypothetical protein
VGSCVEIFFPHQIQLSLYPALRSLHPLYHFVSPESSLTRCFLTMDLLLSSPPASRPQPPLPTLTYTPQFASGNASADLKSADSAQPSCAKVNQVVHRHNQGCWRSEDHVLMLKNRRLRSLEIAAEDAVSSDASSTGPEHAQWPQISRSPETMAACGQNRVLTPDGQTLKYTVAALTTIGVSPLLVKWAP